MLVEIGYEVVINGLKEGLGSIISEIRTTIQSADMIIAIISENYMKSSWAQAELSAAILGMNKKILAIVIGDVPLPSYLSGCAYYKLDV
ncbi:toll/interleukin-1 receptor domain-containing protein [Clostridium estertheticum]|uniref:Toll/interleukin-1 receptor domain-containing protein n=1 Tax=Clostridium estertheticum TaxID=238834 RepID=A0A5N7IZJ5_9CLOT|nr:toll/interleukin-1 receptor domain-containing protein [Clostridium estertheticum]MPQ61917.1 toll/interleukin-1 receptor domain-containing protein [Clostridium estertheticum]